MKRLSFVLVGASLSVALIGCNTQQAGAWGAAARRSTAAPGGTTEAGKPVFTLAWSEYPSWSVFGVAHAKKLINGAEGQMSELELKWGVDIVLKQLTYDACITQYGSGQADAVCITNMDILSPALGRASVAICPTSTSAGADACIVVGIDDVKALREHKVYGLDKSVSEYCFVRNLELLGEKESDHKFTSQGTRRSGPGHADQSGIDQGHHGLEPVRAADAAEGEGRQGAVRFLDDPRRDRRHGGDGQGVARQAGRQGLRLRDHRHVLPRERHDRRAGQLATTRCWPWRPSSPRS